MTEQATADLMLAAPEGAVFVTNDVERAFKVASINLRGDLKIAPPEAVLWFASNIRDIGFPVVIDEGVSFDDYSTGTAEEIDALNATFAGGSS